MPLALQRPRCAAPTHLQIDVWVVHFGEALDLGWVVGVASGHRKRKQKGAAPGGREGRGGGWGAREHQEGMDMAGRRRVRAPGAVHCIGCGAGLR
jgi:hypothetical protein